MVERQMPKSDATLGLDAPSVPFAISPLRHYTGGVVLVYISIYALIWIMTKSCLKDEVERPGPGSMVRYFSWITHH
jgi:hypothetical protein